MMASRRRAGCQPRGADPPSAATPTAATAASAASRRCAGAGAGALPMLGGSSDSRVLRKRRANKAGRSSRAREHSLHAPAPVFLS